MVVIIDNYDSFTYNIVQSIDASKFSCKVYKNDTLSADDIIDIDPTHIIISPGPYSPFEGSGNCIDIVKRLYKRTPILGICLGAQIIASALGGRVIRGANVAHGIVSYISCDNSDKIFNGLPNRFKATRYHSLVIDRGSVEEKFNITATTTDSGLDVVMGISHRSNDLYGVQFHPESIMTDFGKKIINNFLLI